MYKEQMIPKVKEALHTTFFQIASQDKLQHPRDRIRERSQTASFQLLKE